MFHCAIKQEGVDIAFNLTRAFEKERLGIHYFRTIDELLILSQRFPLNLAVIAGKGDFRKNIEMIRLIKSHVFLTVVPMVMYHPDPPEDILISGYENGVDEFITGEKRGRLFEARLRMTAERSNRDISFNPSTRMPGPGMIELEIERLLKFEGDFAVCYADIDDFKPYNDYFGYFYGDRVIKLTARIIRDAVFDLCREGFVGHIGGDDFIFIVPPDVAGRVSENVIKIFDTLIPYRYDEKDRVRGNITTTNRKGEIETFSILTISIAVLINQKGSFKHVGEMSHMLADLKKYSKSLKGSNYVVERRKRY